jgi:hypothetical protein
MLLLIGLEDKFNEFRPMGQITLGNIFTAIQNKVSKFSLFDYIDGLKHRPSVLNIGKQTIETHLIIRNDPPDHQPNPLIKLKRSLGRRRCNRHWIVEFIGMFQFEARYYPLVLLVVP